MAGSVRVYVDVAGSDGLPHVYLGITDSSGTEKYSGYGPVRTAPFGVPGRVSPGLAPNNPEDPKDVAGYIDQTAWGSQPIPVSDEQIADMNRKIQEWQNDPTIGVTGHDTIGVTRHHRGQTPSGSHRGQTPSRHHRGHRHHRDTIGVRSCI